MSRARLRVRHPYEPQTRMPGDPRWARSRATSSSPSTGSPPPPRPRRLGPGLGLCVTHAVFGPRSTAADAGPAALADDQAERDPERRLERRAETWGEGAQLAGFASDDHDFGWIARDGSERGQEAAHPSSCRLNPAPGGWSSAGTSRCTVPSRPPVRTASTTTALAQFSKYGRAFRPAVPASNALTPCGRTPLCWRRRNTCGPKPSSPCQELPKQTTCATDRPLLTRR